MGLLSGRKEGASTVPFSLLVFNKQLFLSAGSHGRKEDMGKEVMEKGQEGGA